MSAQANSLITVVMSVFNDEAYIAAALDSVLNQQGVELELVIVNDGSTDQTGGILDAYAANDSLIRVVHQENTGLTRALITGVKLARGEFIARQDADDLSTANRLGQQLDLISSDPELGFVSCFAEYIGPHGENLDTVKRPLDSQEATKRLLDQMLGPPAHGSVMFRRSVYDSVGGYRPEFYFAQDADLWLRMAEVSRVAYVQEIGYLFRRHEGSISGSSESWQAEFGRLGQSCRTARRTGVSEKPFVESAAELTQSIIAERRQKHVVNHNTKTNSSRARMNYLIASQLLKNKDPLARNYFWKVIRNCPWHWKAWGKLASSLTLRSSDSTNPSEIRKTETGAPS